MKFRLFLISLILIFLNSFAGSFEAGKGTFLLNGSPYIIRAAELHYPRIPKEYWDQRIKLTKALGMNTICLYTFWNIHEPKEGEFDFTGQNDLREFINLCDANGMKVILRPGPYVCAEWEMGGIPWWLLKKKNIQLRELDPYFMERVEAFEKTVAQQVGDLTIQNGGPVIMIQVENEYGAYGENKDYVRAIRDILKQHFGEDILMFQCDWSSNFTINGLEDLLWTMNFGTGADIDSQFARLKEMRPETPLMCSEYWSGWFDKWGANHETRPADEMIEGIAEMLEKGISFSLYMTHGGTNWSHWAGANSPGYSPDVTSYDYDAPINENGHPTEKYWKLREVLSKFTPDLSSMPKLPELIEPIVIDKFSLNEIAPLWDNLPLAIRDDDIKPMEYYDMGFGSIIYSTVLPALDSQTVLYINDAHDFAQVFADGKKIGIIDRRNGDNSVIIPPVAEGARLDILVEAMGRINFGRAIKDHKGITGNVMIEIDNTPKELKNWEVYLLPDELEFYTSLNFMPLDKVDKAEESRLPKGVYRGKFNLEKTSDTFLNFENWGKGLVYINGRGIGRFWEIGPQQTLYVPGPWLNEGENEILVFDILGPENTEIEGLDHPIIDKVKVPETSKAPISVELDFSKGEYYTFEEGAGWKTLRFKQVRNAAQVGIEILSTYDNTLPAISEIYFLDENGRRLSRESWKGKVSCEDAVSGNHNIDKVFDLQESTYWTTVPGYDGPIQMIIEFGTEVNISGMEYLPRVEPGAPGQLKDIRIITPL